MMQPRKLLPVLLLLAAGTARAEVTLACGDLLANLKQKPAYLVYQGCTQEMARQDQPFVARYKVTGRNAQKAERYLHRNYGLPELKRYCCMWDSTQHFWRDRRTGIGHVLVMASGETLVRTREAWPKIDHFEVSVSAYAQDP
jgi:hypothetical protein